MYVEPVGGCWFDGETPLSGESQWRLSKYGLLDPYTAIVTGVAIDGTDGHYSVSGLPAVQTLVATKVGVTHFAAVDSGHNALFTGCPNRVTTLVAVRSVVVRRISHYLTGGTKPT